MKDNRNEMIPAQFADWAWDLTGYVSKVPFYNADYLTMREVQNVFQLDPEPPKMKLNDYIREASPSQRPCILFLLPAPRKAAERRGLPISHPQRI